MRIKKINLINFGKFKRKEIELKEGFNIIYGINEAGKSTIQSFIRIMLYGMGSQKKAIKDNDRKRFLPWRGGRIQGELVVETEEEEIIIKRSFGETKKEDLSEILHNITGEKISYLDSAQPGKDLLGLGNEGFSKTLFLKQLGAEVGRDREDEIIKRLTNLEQAGDESTSYQRGIKLLEEGKKAIQGLRKAGKLEELREDLQALNEELKEGHILAEDNIEDQKRFNLLKEKIGFLQNHIKKLEFYKNHVKRLKLQQEYKEIVDYLKSSEELNKQREEVSFSLDNGLNTIDENFIYGLQQEIVSYGSMKESIEVRREQLAKLEEEKAVITQEIKDYSYFNDIDNNLELKLVTLQKDITILEEKIRDLNSLEESIRILTEEENDIIEELGSLMAFEDTRKDIDRILYDYEGKLKELKEKYEDYEKSAENSIKRISLNSMKNEISSLEGTQKRSYTISVLSIIGIFTSIFLAMNTTFMNNTMIFYGGAFIFTLMLIGSYFKINKIKHKLLGMNNYKDKLQYIENLSEKIGEVEKSLGKFYGLIGVSTYEDFIRALKTYDLRKVTLERTRIKIEEKLLQKKDYKKQEMMEELHSKTKYLEFILNHTKSSTINELLNKYKDYKICNDNYELVQREIESLEESLYPIEKDMEVKKNIIYERLKSIKKDYIPMELIGEELERIQKKLYEKRQLEMKIANMENSYKVLLKDRDINELKKQLENFLDEDIDEVYKDEDSIEEALKNSNEDLLNYSKELKDVENLIANRFLGKRPVVNIEEDIERTKKGIALLEEKLEIIELTLEILRECFKELQKNFGPKLNSRVDKIFGEITEKNYEEIKVSEDYTMKMRHREQGEIIPIDYLSSGTVDQIYLALRLGLIDLIYGDNPVTILLDDAFIQYDEVRLSKALNYLLHLSKHKQIILFTCQNREVELLKEKANIIFV